MEEQHRIENSRGGGNGGCLPWLIGFLLILWLCSR